MSDATKQTLTQIVAAKVEEKLDRIPADKQEEKRARTRFGLLIIAIAAVGGFIIIGLQGADLKILLSVLGVIALAVWGAIMMSGEWALIGLQKFFLTVSKGVRAIKGQSNGDG